MIAKLAESRIVSAGSQAPDDYRKPTYSGWRAPRAAADGGGGTVIATAEVAGTPERVFRALTTDEVEHWWGDEGFYRLVDWKADFRVCGRWSVTICFADGSMNRGSGEFVELCAPHRVTMTRRFNLHPLLGTRETTITYRLEPTAEGTRVTVREEGFVGRSEAAYENAEYWERVPAWLNRHLASEHTRWDEEGQK
jgi:uncharacterized protein YndB with AHSA1/START domain